MSEATQTISEPRLRGHLPFKDAVIYVLRDPRNGAIRYVGVTTKQLQRRLNEHTGAARRGERNHAYAWLRQVLSAEMRPIIEAVEEVPAGGDWIGAERRWIAALRESGAKLTNLTAGGDGAWGFRRTPEQLAALKVALTGRKFSAIGRANMSAAKKGRGQPAWLVDLPSPMRGKQHTADARRKMGATKKANGFTPWMKGKQHSPEAIEKQRAAKIDNPNITTVFKARAVIVDGIQFSSMSAAGRHFGVLQRDINYWIRRGRASYL